MKTLKKLIEQHKTNKRCKQLVKAWTKSYIEPKASVKHIKLSKVLDF